MKVIFIEHLLALDPGLYSLLNYLVNSPNNLMK